MQGGSKTHDSEYDYFDVTFFTDPTVKSLVLLRGQEINGPYPVVFVGAYAVGPVVSTDTIVGTSSREFERSVRARDAAGLDEGQQHRFRVVSEPRRWRNVDSGSAGRAGFVAAWFPAIR
jgi:hypothetical protein